MSNSAISVVIVDDEPLAREGLRIMVDQDADLELVGEAQNGPEAIEAIRQARPDLVLLDVQMPGMNGFEVLAALDRSELPQVVFVTAFEEYALHAFDVSAVDYLLKPFDDQRFQTAMARAKRRVATAREDGEDSAASLLDVYETARREAAASNVADESTYRRRFAVRTAGRVLFVDTDEIDWIEAADYYVQLHVGQTSHLLRRSMTQLESELDPEQFIRIHRSSIVNVKRIVEIRREAARELYVVLDDGVELKVSRRHRKRVRSLA
jgi:two-component system LytT family response regulator